MRRDLRLRGGWVRRPWGRLRVWRAGWGPTVLAIHGLGGSGRYWDSLARRVSDRFTVVAPDLAGFGRSDKPRVAYERAFHLENLEAVVRATSDDEPVAVVGHSLGALLGALWAAEHPEDVAALVLAAAPFPTGDGLPAWARRGTPRAVRAAARAARAAWPVVGVPIGVVRGYPRATVVDFGRQRLHSRMGTLASTLWDPTTTGELEPLRALDPVIPALLMHARDDRTVPLEDQARWAELLPNAERRVLQDGGHQFLLRSGFADLASWLRALPEP